MYHISFKTSVYAYKPFLKTLLHVSYFVLVSTVNRPCMMWVSLSIAWTKFWFCICAMEENKQCACCNEIKITFWSFWRCSKFHFLNRIDSHIVLSFNRTFNHRMENVNVLNILVLAGSLRRVRFWSWRNCAIWLRISCITFHTLGTERCPSNWCAFSTV